MDSVGKIFTWVSGEDFLNKTNPSTLVLSEWFGKYGKMVSVVSLNGE